MARFVGLDVHRRVVEACVLDEAGKIVLRHRFDPEDGGLEHFARTRLLPGDRAVVEATTSTWEVARVLTPYAAEVVISNPMQTRLIARAKIKTDKVDALVLAQLLRCDFLPRVWEPDEPTQELRRLTSRRAALVADRTAIKNRLHAVLAQRLIRPPSGELFGRAGLAWLRAVALDAEARLLVDSDLRLMEAIDREVEALDLILARRGYEDGRVKLLMSLPGVDVTAALGLLAALGDIGRFRDADHAASYLGLVPTTRQSADRCYHGPITKAGNGHARYLLIQAAQNVRNHPGPLGAFFRRLAQRKGHNVAVTATARKLVVIAWHVLTKGEPYRYAQPEATQAKYRRLRTRATGQRRRPGPAPGSRAEPKLGAGTRSRTVKALEQVYEAEGLPRPGEVTAGEARAIEQSGTRDFISSLAGPRVTPRRSRTRSGARTGVSPDRGESPGAGRSAERDVGVTS